MKSVWLVEKLGEDYYAQPVAIKSFKSVVEARKFCIEMIEKEIAEPEYGDPKPRESVHIDIRRDFEHFSYDDYKNVRINRAYYGFTPRQGTYGRKAFALDKSGDPPEMSQNQITSTWMVRKMEFVA